MALKRKPPAGNIRRVVSIGDNLRYAITSKADETVQCESFQERKLTLLFDRDSSIQQYSSQPERFAFTDSQGHSRTYVPDFIVWRTTGEIEIHEVTLTERKARSASNVAGVTLFIQKRRTCWLCIAIGPPSTLMQPSRLSFARD